MLYRLLRPLLLSLSPELNRKATLGLLSGLHKLNTINPFLGEIKPQNIDVMGIKFPNPIGMAAGLDLDGKHIDTLLALGFGHVEIGTITPRAQANAHTAYLYYQSKTECIMNNLGFSNIGVEQLWLHLSKRKFSGVLGINIGKNSSTPDNMAVLDYQYCMQRLYNFASYFTVNIANVSDNVGLLSGIKQTQQQQADKYSRYVPLVIKISPNLSGDRLQYLLDILVKYQVDGIIVANATAMPKADDFSGRRQTNESPGVHTKCMPEVSKSSQQPRKFICEGYIDDLMLTKYTTSNAVDNLTLSQCMAHSVAISGRPLKQLADSLLLAVAEHLGGCMPIISSGGIFSAVDVNRRLQHGANLVQLYSALIYRGPSVVRQIVSQVYTQNR